MFRATSLILEAKKNDGPINVSRLDRDFSLRRPEKYEAFWKERRCDFIPQSYFEKPHVSLEIGAGTGWMILELARQNPEQFFIAIERDRMRAQQLVKRSEKSKLTNVASFRGNAIPALMHGIPSESVDRIYILYPCPWPKTSQRKHRWYLHPAMAHMVRILKPRGKLIWASDQAFYIDEAKHICTSKYQLSLLQHGPLTSNAHNHLEAFPTGRTKFEAAFLASGQPCYELIVQKS